MSARILTLLFFPICSLALTLLPIDRLQATTPTFGDPQRMAISSSAADFGSGISPDNQSLYFQTCTSFATDCDLRVAERDGDSFSPAKPVPGAFNSRANELYPSISPDGLELYFSDGLVAPFDNFKRRRGSRGGDIWVSSRSTVETGFDEVRNLEGINTSSLESYPHLSPDGNTLLFASNRRGGEGQTDIYMATREALDQPFEDPVNLGPGVNSRFQEGRATLSSDGLFLFFDSNRPGGQGGYDIWMAERSSDDGLFGNAKNLGASVNSSVLDSGPSLSSDGATLYFESFRSPNFGLGADLWQVSVSGLQLSPIPGDFNGDGLLTAEDIDALSLAARNGNAGSSFDLNRDGLVDQSDRSTWVLDLADTHFGDADLNGSVQFDDFLSLAAEFGQAGGWSTGDFDGNGLVQFPDFLQLAANFGSGSETAKAVPESVPAPFFMMSALACLLHRYRRCRVPQRAATSRSRTASCNDTCSASTHSLPDSCCVCSNPC